jgi:transcriptional regulator GlxA family with amidase domain
MILNDTVGDNVLSFDDRDKTGTEDEFSSLRESVNDHIGEPNLERILSIQYGLQPDRLNSLFEQKYGISLQNYIVNRKFNKVKELLRFTIKSIDEIISEVGIEDEKALRDYFMETEEMTPEDYRRRWAQWIKS